MSSSLRLGLLLASLGVLFVIIFSVANKRLNIRYSIVWLLWALMSLVMAVFPETFYSLSHLLGQGYDLCNTVIVTFLKSFFIKKIILKITISKRKYGI